MFDLYSTLKLKFSGLLKLNTFPIMCRIELLILEIIKMISLMNRFNALSCLIWTRISINKLI